MLRLLIGFLLMLTCNLLQAQEYNYNHFTVREGLPGNAIYSVVQDKDGFIWIATDGGVSRFDGRQFVNFNTQDGLPATEIIMLYADAKGRIWMSPLRNTVCYYYKGKIYNSQNDSLVSKLAFNGTVFYYAENKNGELLIGGTAANDTYIIDSNNNVTPFKTELPIHVYYSVTGSPEGSGFITCTYADDYNKESYSHTYNLFDKGKRSLWVQRTYNFRSGYAVFRKEINGKTITTDSLYQPEFRKDIGLLMFAYNNQQHFLKFPKKLIGHPAQLFDEGLLVFYGSNGARLIDTATGVIVDSLLTGKRCGRGTVDSEKNIWVPTLKYGLYMLPSREFKTRKFRNEEGDIYSIYKDGNKLIVGSSYGRMYELENNKVKTIDFSTIPFPGRNTDVANRLLQISRDGKDLLLSTDCFVLRYDPVTGKKKVSNADVIKSIEKLNKDTLLVATGRGCLLLNSQTLKVIDTIYRYRSYAAVQANNAFYVGTAGGLYKVRKDKSTWFAGSAIPALQNIISHIRVVADGSQWVGTLGGGIVHLRNDSVLHHFNALNGLTSSNCKSIFADGRFIWVGTEKGLNRIDLLRPENPIVHYTIADGLASNDILAVYTQNRMVYVGTGEGLTCFDFTRITQSSTCNLNILSVQAGNRVRNTDSLNNINYKENDFRFNYTGISFRSLDDMKYFYRLIGLKDTWDSTRNTSLTFLALPPGDYELQLFAVNKFGINSKTIRIPFYIRPPFWATWWFRILVACSVVGLVWWFIARRIKQEQAKAATQNRINELEQQALRSQMNPHFIFNCLNSIQNFLLHNDFEKTNEYLSSFAHLIRQTLDNSSRESISLSSEIRYLNSYLDLESMRFAHSFQHSVSIDPLIDSDNTHIPPMILQPYVENSIRHGLRYRQEGAGSVKIKFERRGNTLLCIVEDNGVGRKKAGELKSFMHVEYQSKGMRLTAERIEAMNRRQETPITVDVVDLEQAGNATGTQVIVRFPNIFL